MKNDQQEQQGQATQVVYVVKEKEKAPFWITLATIAAVILVWFKVTSYELWGMSACCVAAMFALLRNGAGRKRAIAILIITAVSAVLRIVSFFKVYF